ncbi:MAG: hypothetical protein JSR40_15990 [Proteobacteria bacterium]|nr:hypothetical protein [Pseudomonadota bacterium]
MKNVLQMQLYPPVCVPPDGTLQVSLCVPAQDPAGTGARHDDDAVRGRVSGANHGEESMRHPVALQQLSETHQLALELAEQISRAKDDASIERLMTTVPAVFQRVLEPHLAIEESALLARLDAAGQEEIVRYTLDEHRNLRILAGRIASGDNDSLQDFWITLHALVRFEERELFRIAEAVLPQAVLDHRLQPRDQ